MRKLPQKTFADKFRSRLLGTLDPVIDLAYRRTCTICDSLVGSYRLGSTCRHCWSDARSFSSDDPLCFKCGKMMVGSKANSDQNCHECADHFYDNAIAIGRYAGAIKHVILSLKSTPTIPDHLFELIDARIADCHQDDIDLVIPIPLSERRQLERGFNQAQVIAEPIGRLLNVDVDDLSLARIRHSPIHRAGMDRKAREKTVVKAFAVKRPRLIDGKHILLVDDVLTSGSTASACAKELKANGAISVSLFTIGRA